MAIKAISGTTTANTASSVSLSAAYPRIRIFNRSTAEMWVRVDGTAATVAGDDCFFIAAGKDDYFNVPANMAYSQGGPLGQPTSTTASIISTAAAAYTVTAAA